MSRAKIEQLQRQAQAAKNQGDERGALGYLRDLARIMPRPLTPEQIAAQAQYIADQATEPQSKQ